jgi:DNA-binding HxlR family transcriptional regulator
MRHASLSARVPCPIARSLEIVGEWWTLLIVRDALLGARRFDDFRATGIADNVLTARLKKLTDDGLLTRRAYQHGPTRYEYLLTERGLALAPVILALRTWGRRWTRGDDPSEITHAVCEGDLGVAAYCERCASAVPPAQVSIERSGGRARRRNRARVANKTRDRADRTS